MKKALKILAVVFVVGMVVFVLALSSIVSSAVKYGVEEFAPAFVGAPVTLETVDISIFSGRGTIKGLVVKNPEGFKTEFAIKLDEATMDIDVGSLLSDTIIVEQILVDGPQVTYEGTMETSNMKAIMANVEKATQSTEEEAESVTKDTPDGEKKSIDIRKIAEKIPSSKKSSDDKTQDVTDAEGAEEAGAGKKLIIADFTIKNGNVNVSSVLLGGKVIPVPMPNIHLVDIGKDSDGASISDVFKEVMGEINNSVGSAATSILKPLDAISDGAKELGDSLGKGAKELEDSLGKGAKDLGDGAKDIGDKVEKEANKLLKGIGGLFGDD